MNINLEITPAEWQIMRVVWSLKQTTSSQIIEVLQRKVDWKPATIKTLLRRLVDKKALQATRQGRGFIYRPLVPEQQTMDQAADNLFDNICERHVGCTLGHVISNAALSKEDIRKLQSILDSKFKEAPEQVKCNCIPGKEMNC
ncbi:CopY/TcrY family copper transport repressor [Limosilactobacillus sp. STM2_1]|uniref:CopY/TcrY family copper transport repressor n=1 Tax=Limosilactobacillus rudii TaxID=2759755 RepID=A0A7W3UKL1_9LACO|nr:CopY/TcrY family copper transport repressor [Limosilactobacillus rudii]MBB1078702.1 CopY/TcrY family copper transport repressor [Limosilactobacillus rudii]MBB1096730.1 CopY/TcrY family copper transport repressor [Limosilactobacillus rudii]MCD7135598.1 CopY/TcrY family copper transport repressor [Limosilactobacillus rudii]